MIYGLNFNGTPIPLEYSAPPSHRLALKGVCDTMAEASDMKLQATNGHRIVIVIPLPHKGFGVYCA